MQIFLSNIECPECHSHNCVKYVGRFCGVIYGCCDCENTFKPESAPNNARTLLETGAAKSDGESISAVSCQ